MTSKLCTGGGEDVRHSSVRPSHGSGPAGGPCRSERTALIAKSRIESAMPKAPIVDIRFQNSQPRPGPYV